MSIYAGNAYMTVSIQFNRFSDGGVISGSVLMAIIGLFFITTGLTKKNTPLFRKRNLKFIPISFVLIVIGLFAGLR